MPTSNNTGSNQIEQLISAGELKLAHDRFRDFLMKCEDEKDTLVQNQARFANLEKDELLGIKAEGTFDQNKILWDFVTQLRKFRREVLTTFFDVSDREQFFKNIADRDEFLKEILSLRITSKNYSIDELLKEGNSSVFYRLINHELGRHAIASVLKLPKLTDQAKSDIKFLTDLKHRNIIKLLDYDLSSFPFFVINEYVYGCTMTVAIETTGPRSVSQGVDWLYQLTDALDYLRHKRIFHTNIRPSKIYVDDEWEVMISPLDIHGVMTEEPTYKRYMDTCQYGSPETLAIFGAELPSLREDDSTLKKLCLSDQYSIGLIGYKIFTGLDLFEGKTAHEILENRKRFGMDKAFRKEKLAQLPESVVHLKVGNKTTLKAILEKLLSEDPAQRYPDLHKLLRAFHPFTHADYPAIKLVNGSYRRCLATNREFIKDFYKAFFKVSPSENDFREVGKKRQLSMLQLAVDVLLDLENRKGQLVNILGRGPHQKYGAADFESFLDTLLETVKRNDPLFDEHIAADWERVKGQVLAIIGEVLEKKVEG